MARKYDRETKVKICMLAIEDNIKVKKIAEAYGMNANMIHRWIKEYTTYGDDAFVGAGNLRKEDARLKKLEKENEELKMEIEILKKAAAYFLNPKEEE